MSFEQKEKNLVSEIRCALEAHLDSIDKFNIQQQKMERELIGAITNALEKYLNSK